MKLKFLKDVNMFHKGLGRRFIMKGPTRFLQGAYKIKGLIIGFWWCCLFTIGHLAEAECAFTGGFPIDVGYTS